MIARILAINPEFIVADEPTSSLDVNVQAQMLSLLKKVREKFGLTCLFISHDLEVINTMSDKIAVMYLGKDWLNTGKLMIYSIVLCIHTHRHYYLRSLSRIQMQKGTE